MRNYRKKKFLFIIILSFSLLYSNLSSTSIAKKDDTFSFPLSHDHPVIIRALNYLKNQQAEDGSIAGFSISSWVSMAFASVNDGSDSFDRLTRYLMNSKDKISNSNKATDWQRYIMGLTARNNSFVKSNCEWFTGKLWSFYHDQQFGNKNNIYDDCFGLFALYSMGNDMINQTVKEGLRQNLINLQHRDGGWNDVDTTSLVLMALNICGESAHSSVIKNAIKYLWNHVDSSGGLSSWGSINIASTAWAVSALNCYNISINDFYANITLKNPVQFLIELQQEDGSFNYTKTSNLNPEWMTSYAIISLSGNYFPVTRLFLTNDRNDSNSDAEDDEEKRDENNKDQNTDQEISTKECSYYFHVKSPTLKGIHFNDKFISAPFKKPVILGPCCFSIETNASIDIVAFYINNDLYHIDNTEPYLCEYNTKNFCKNIRLSVYGYSFRKSDFDLFLNETSNGQIIKTYLRNCKHFYNYFILEKYIDVQYYLMINI